MLYLDRKLTIRYNDQQFWENEAMFWNKYGRIYHYLEAGTPYKKMLNKIKELIKNDYSRWFDAGCGPGTMIELLLNFQPNVKQVVGVDFDGVMIDQASRRLSSYNNVEILQLDLSKHLPFNNNHFDGIVANLVLSYIIIYENKYVGESALIKV